MHGTLRCVEKDGPPSSPDSFFVEHLEYCIDAPEKTLCKLIVEFRSVPPTVEASRRRCSLDG